MSLNNNIEKHLYKMMNVLRGEARPHQSVQIILTLLLLKFLSIYEDHDFDIPESAKWSSVKSLNDDVGGEIKKALDDLSKANKELPNDKNINFQTVGNLENISDGVFKDIIELIDGVNFQKTIFDEIPPAGKAIEYLIKIYSDHIGRKGGAYYTPRNISKLIVEIVQPEEGMSIYDPAVGSGGMLVEVGKWLQSQEITPDEIDFFGQDISGDAVYTAKINLVMNEINNAHIYHGDTLLDPKNVENGSLILFDRILSQPPFSLKLKPQKREALKKDSYDRFPHGVELRTADFLFIQHIITSLKDDGKAAIIVPPSVLSRQSAGIQIRSSIVDDDLVESVIILPQNTLFGTGISPCLLVINKLKADHKKGKIIFVYGAEEYEADEKSYQQRIISRESRQKITKVIAEFDNIEGFSKVVSQRDIKEKRYNLYPPSYVDIIGVNKFLGGEFDRVKLSDIASVKMGTSYGKNPRGEGEVPILKSRDLGSSIIDPDELESTSISDRKANHLQAEDNDILLSRYGEKFRTLLVDDHLEGLLVDRSIYIIRLRKDWNYLKQYLIEFFRSDKGQGLLGTCDYGMNMRGLYVNSLRDLVIPVPEKSAIELIDQLHETELDFLRKVDQSRELKKKVFSIEDPERVNTKLRELSTEAQILSSGILQSDDLDYQIRNYYPFPIAFTYRNLSAVHNKPRLYQEQLRVSENLLAFLGIIGLSITANVNQKITSDYNELSYRRIRKKFAGGVSPGHWYQIAYHSAKFIKENLNSAFSSSFSGLWFKGSGSSLSDFGKELKRIIEWKNDFKHDRGPKTDHQYEEMVKELNHKLEYCYDELSFFVQYPIRLVKDMDIDWQTEKRLLDTLVYKGDHPGLIQEQVEYEQTLPKNKLYLETSDENWINLYPLMSVRYCPKCENRETYFYDMWDGPGHKARLKSFERGHTHDDDQDAEEASLDFEHWLSENFPQGT